MADALPDVQFIHWQGCHGEPLTYFVLRTYDLFGALPLLHHPKRKPRSMAGLNQVTGRPEKIELVSPLEFRHDVPTAGVNMQCNLPYGLLSTYYVVVILLPPCLPGLDIPFSPWDMVVIILRGQGGATVRIVVTYPVLQVYTS